MHIFVYKCTLKTEQTMKRTKLCALCLLELRMSGPIGHITFCERVTIGCATGAKRFNVYKMFHRLSRDLSNERKEIFVSVNTDRSAGS